MAGTFALLAVLLAVFGVGFVVGVAYAVWAGEPG